MKQPPVLLFAFANDKEAYLNALEQEERQLRNVLSPLQDQKKIELLSLGSTSIDDIYRAFNRFYNRIQIFHFGGHSDASFLNFSDHKQRASNLALLMGMQDQLQLVVLNGCSNKDQVTTLQNAGVKVVIATSKELRDDLAPVFAEQFYNALIAGKNIKSAYHTATGYLEAQLDFDRTQTREGTLSGARAGRKETIQENEFLPWGLYWLNEKDLEYTIPQEIFDPKDLKDFNIFQTEVPLSGNSLNLNKELVLRAAEGLKDYHADIKALLNINLTTPNPALFNSLQNVVIDKYPSIISIHIRDLFTEPALLNGRKRLRELNEVYISLAQLLLSIVMANLWEACLDEDFNRRTDFEIRNEYRKDLHDFLYQNQTSTQHLDYIWLLATLHRILEENNLLPFVEELSNVNNLLQKDKVVYLSARFLEQELRQRLIGQNIHADEVTDLCLEAEKHLGTLLQVCGFLSVYEFISVKDIKVYKRRRRLEAAFMHEKAVLKGRDLSTIDSLPIPRNPFTDDHSMLVSRNLAGGDKVLSLSPFLIDLNAFSAKKHSIPKLYFFHHRTDNKTFVYQQTEVMTEFFTLEPNYNHKEYTDLEVLIELFHELEQDLNL